MKILTTVMLFLLVQIVSAQNQLSDVVHFNYDQSDLTSQASSELDELISRLDNHKIYQITLSGHTDSDGSNEYNEGLSARRVDAVRTYLLEHGISSEHIQLSTWGETKPVAANNVLSEKYKNRRVEITVEFESSIPKGFTGSFQEIKVRSNGDTSIVLDEKGTLLHIPADAFVYDGGSCDEITLRYKEYRNSADMAFSQIPMNYTSGGITYRFSSSGMFELYGSCDRHPVKIAPGKSLKIDYALARQNPDIAFYRLKDDRSNWDRIQEIEKLPGNDGAEVANFKNQGLFQPNVQRKKRWLIHLGPVKIIRLKDKIIDRGDRLVGWNKVPIQNAGKQDGTLLAEGADAGHTYPDIIKGLNVGDFGVYNCDQAYRMSAPVTVRANFVNEHGMPVKDGTVLSMIDMNYNGAFSYSPLSFQCDVKGKNALALFTQSDQLYVITPDEFKKTDLSDGQVIHTIKLKNVTQEIHNSDELASYLGIAMKD
ncbi:MAG: OmpA family protein [Bacteroidetes bacterium]|nr:OmpA family protein [Bacteroidota bacterium]